LVSVETLLVQAPTYLDAKVSRGTVEEAQELQRGPRAELLRAALSFEDAMIQVLREKEWPIVHQIPILLKEESKIPRFEVDAAVPFQTGSSPNASMDYVVFDALYSGSPRGIRMRIRDRLERGSLYHMPLVIVVPELPEEVKKRLLGRLPDEVYECEWGTFPKYQVISLQELIDDEFTLPVEAFLGNPETQRDSSDEQGS
jgi:hypothetical protein